MPKLIKRIKNKIKTVPLLSRLIFSPYYRLRTSLFVTSFLNRQAEKLFKENRLELDAVSKRITGELKENGIAITHLEELSPERNTLSELHGYLQTIISKAKTGRKKTFLEYLWQAGVLLDLKNPFLKLSVEPKILEIINSYLECASKFKFSSLARTVPITQDKETTGSQRWHRDPGVRRLCKMFIYLTDVLDEGAGPFIYIKGSHLSGRWGKIFPQEFYGREGIYPPEGEVEKIVPKEDIKTCLGKAGTIIFCDTIGLHKGGYSTTKERVMYTALYERPSAFGKPKFKYPPDFKEQIKNLPEISKFALT